MSRTSIDPINAGSKLMPPFGNYVEQFQSNRRTRRLEGVVDWLSDHNAEALRETPTPDGWALGQNPGASLLGHGEHPLSARQREHCDAELPL